MGPIPILPFRMQNCGEESGMLSRWLLDDEVSIKEMRSGHQLIQRHGVKLMRTHFKEMLTDIRYPHQSNTVPSWAVPVISIILPLMVVFPVCYYKKDVYDLHHAVLGLLFSVLITGVITDAIKDAVGRPRPDFFWRCFPDGNELYDPVTGNVICHGEEQLIVDGHKSFPSGHTSWSFAGLGFLALYISGKIQAFDQRGHVAKLCFIFLPLFIASLVGISRVDDYRHHWQDVFAGGLLGLVVATFCYLQFFPAPYHSHGWATYGYFRALTEFNVASNPSNNANQQSEAVINFGSPRPQFAMTADDESESGRDEELQALI